MIMKFSNRYHIFLILSVIVASASAGIRTSNNNIRRLNENNVGGNAASEDQFPGLDLDAYCTDLDSENCCKCKPECCSRCPRYNPTTDLTRCDDKDENKPGHVSSVPVYLFSLVTLFIVWFLSRTFRRQYDEEIERRRGEPQMQPSNRVPSEKEQQERVEEIPNKFHVHEVPEDGVIEESVLGIFQSLAAQALSLVSGSTTTPEDGQAQTEESTNTSSADDFNSDPDVTIPTTDSECDEAGEREKRPKSPDIESNVPHEAGRPRALSTCSSVDLSEVECSICLNNYSSGDVICVSKHDGCNHVFHQDCLAEWLKTKDHCPLCRVDLMN